jgi:hypothetical protein
MIAKAEPSVYETGPSQTRTSQSPHLCFLLSFVFDLR